MLASVKKTGQSALPLGFPERCNNTVVINVSLLDSTELREWQKSLFTRKKIVKKFVIINQKFSKFGF